MSMMIGTVIFQSSHFVSKIMSHDDVTTFGHL